MFYQGIFAAIMTSIAWAFTGIWIQSLAMHDYQHIVFYRFACTALVLFILLVILEKKRFLQQFSNLSNWILALFMVGFFIAAPYAYTVSSVTEVTLCINTAPLFVLCYNFIKTRRLSVLEIVGVVFSMLGILIVLAHHNPTLHRTGQHMLGDLAGLICAALTAAYAIFYRHSKDNNLKPHALYVVLIGALLGLGLFAINNHHLHQDLLQYSFSSREIYLFLGLVVLSTIIPVITLSYASATLSALMVTQIRNLTPLLATLLAALLLHEHLANSIYFGGLLTLIGIFLILRPPTLQS